MDDSDDQYEDYHDDQAPQFTKILDLTNGEGGERRCLQMKSKNNTAAIVLPQQEPLPPPSPPPPPLPPPPPVHLPTLSTSELDHLAAAAEDVAMDLVDGIDEGEETEDDEEIAMNSTESSSNPHAAVARSTKTGGGAKLVALLTGGSLNPNTPGRVVETGQEQTGRWTKQEHEAFLEALRMYGKEWKKVAAKVKTRTVVQTRTHAQKYFQKLQKAQENSLGGTAEVDYVEMGISDSPLGTTTKTRSNSLGGSAPPVSSKKKQRVLPSAAVIATTTVPVLTVAAAPTSSSISVLALPKVVRRSSTATMTAAQLVSGLGRPSCTAASAPPVLPLTAESSMDEGRPPRPQHGFLTDSIPSYQNLLPTPAGWASAVPAVPCMSIVAPDPMTTIKKGQFPEPSPAATGKRKLAEIAAARMLAGVAGVALPPKDQTIPPSFGDDTDDRATPPPDYGDAGMSFKDAPLPPLFGGADRRPEGGGFSLQIVNPETLGVSHEKRSRGGDSPTTPWDNQLEALVNEKAKTTPSEIPSEPEPTGMAALLESVSGNAHLCEQRRRCHPVCGPGSGFSRSTLHSAVCEMDIESLKSQLREIVNRSPSVLERLDTAGYAPLHTAASLRMIHPDYAVAAIQTVRILLAAGADPNIQDRDGNSPLHWAARAGDADVAEALLLRNIHMDSKNKWGETALHWGMRAGRGGERVVTVLVDNGARVSLLSHKFKRPADVAAEGFFDDDASIASIKARDGNAATVGDGWKKLSRELKKAFKEKMEEIRACRKKLFSRSNPSRTLVLHHPECLEHVPKSQADWEAPDRVISIMSRISAAPVIGKTQEIKDNEVTLSTEFERANLDLLSRVHSTNYLHFVQSLSKDLEKQVKATSSADGGNAEGQEGRVTSTHVVPFTPMVQRSMIKVSESAVKSVSNSDTAFSAGSLRAARRAAGAVQHAVDCVLVGRNRNSFCAVRPPGHHAGVSGLLDGGESCGFCIFNNVAAGALYAISDERLLCERCAIVDIDVHHGNGTEEIVRKCHDPSKLFFFSIHLYDNEKKKQGKSQFYYKFYPGTGAEDDLAMNIINVPIIPLWKELSNTTPPVTRTHNTRQKARSSDQEEESPPATTSGSGRNSDAGSESGSVVNPSPRPPPAKPVPGSGRMAYREAIQNRLLPALRAFNPDLILISAGFDAAKGDVGNAKHERGGRERVGLDLEPEDYAWTTRKILEIADICCSGRVVSVLEGGYGRSPLVSPQSANEDEPPKPLDRGIFSECAIRHLHAMIDPYDVEHRFSTTS